jgi:hypothetical protein
MRISVIAALVLASSAAFAEPTKYIQGGMLFGAAEPVIGWNVMATVDGGYRFSDALWAHVELGYGPTVANLGNHGANGGTNGEVRAGVEARWCAHRMVCGIAGVDLGVQRGTWSTTMYSATVIDGVLESLTSEALVAIPRAGLDLGGDTFRVRLVLEADTAVIDRTTTTTEMASPTSESRTGIIGVELAMGVAYQW